jgi:hypothetical protein
MSFAANKCLKFIPEVNIFGEFYMSLRVSYSTSTLCGFNIFILCML